MEASIKLVQEMGGKIIECCFVIDLPDVGGSTRLRQQGHQLYSLCSLMIESVDYYTFAAFSTTLRLSVNICGLCSVVNLPIR